MVPHLTSLSTRAPGERPLPSDFYGEWRTQSQLANLKIWPNGRLDWSSQRPGNTFNLNGARATLSPDRKTLIARLFVFAKHWNINQPPHAVNGHSEMILDGVSYQRVTIFSADGNKISI
jgi:hypothetical protein